MFNSMDGEDDFHAATPASSEPVVEYLAPAPAVILPVSAVDEFVAPAPAVYAAPAPVDEFVEWHGIWKGCWVRVAVRSVLEDHETAILELECEVECLVHQVDLLGKLVSGLQDIAYKTKDRSLTIAELGLKL